MTKSMRAAPSRFSTDEEQLVQFEKLLLSLEGQLFDGLIFQVRRTRNAPNTPTPNNRSCTAVRSHTRLGLPDGRTLQGCIEQEFDFPGLVEVRNNRVFKTEFLLNLQTIHASLASRLANPMTGYPLPSSLPSFPLLFLLFSFVFFAHRRVVSCGVGTSWA
jgi:hypothetical protein